MTALYEGLSPRKEKDIVVLADFVSIYCRENHRKEPKEVFSANAPNLKAIIGNKEFPLCSDCRKLLNHGMAKLALCTQDPKPMCKKCSVHCYAPGYREKIKEVMKFSGLYLVKHGRVDLVYHYFS